MKDRMKIPKGYCCTLDDLWNVIKTASAKGIPHDAKIRFGLIGGYSVIVSDEDWNSSSVNKEWNDKDDPEDMKRIYKEIKRNFPDPDGTIELDGVESEIIVDFYDDSIEFKITNVSCL